MRTIRTTKLALAIGACALLVAASGGASTAVAAPSGAASDPCPASAQLHVGTGKAALYSTVAPFEHYGSDRSQVFPATCSLRQLTGEAHPRIAARKAPGTYAAPYVSATRNRGELFVYGYGADPGTDGAFVARVDTHTLRETWRTLILDRTPATGGWAYPGVMLVHRNGFIYADFGNAIVKLDPRSGRTLARRNLPEDPDNTGAAYNGMIVMPDGRIVAKKIERGPCNTVSGLPPTAVAFSGLNCAAVNSLPSVIVVLDPGNLRIISSVVPPEPLTGRVTWGRLDGRDYVYGAGSSSLYRFHYSDGKLRLDRSWGPVTYRTGAQRPGTGPGLMNGFVVVQTNFLQAAEPLTVTAVSQRNPDRVFHIQPFAGTGSSSWIVSKPALDAANSIIISHDTAAHRIAAVHLDPKRGLRVRWTRELTSLAFSALVGPPNGRQIVIPDSTGGAGDSVVWLSERSGAEMARSPVLDPSTAPGNIVTPGFGGRFYYEGVSGGLWELRPRAGG